MRRLPLGRTGIDVTELGLGASGIGNMNYAVTDDQAVATVASAWAHGIRMFDTAPHYGLGLSEKRLKVALGSRPRDEFVLSTKVGRLLRPNGAPIGSDLGVGGFDVRDDLMRVWDFSADGVRRSLDESLNRLGLDRVDIVYVHDPDDHVDQSIKEAIPALIALRDEGMIRAVGVGMNQWQAPLRIVNESDIDVVMLAGRWTLLDRTGEKLLDTCHERGVAVVVAAPFNSGILAKSWPGDGAHYDYEAASPEQMQRAQDLARRCTLAGTELPTAAIKFPLRHPAVAAVVVGLRSPHHVASAVTRMNSEVDEDLWRSLADFGPRTEDR